MRAARNRGIRRLYMSCARRELEDAGHCAASTRRICVSSMWRGDRPRSRRTRPTISRSWRRPPRTASACMIAVLELQSRMVRAAWVRPAAALALHANTVARGLTPGLAQLQRILTWVMNNRGWREKGSSNRARRMYSAGPWRGTSSSPAAWSPRSARGWLRRPSGHFFRHAATRSACGSSTPISTSTPAP